MANFWRIELVGGDEMQHVYNVRGKRVMLDADLAELYNCNGTKMVNLAVKRHIKRFPNDFMFRLTRDEYYDVLRLRNGTIELKQGQYSKYLPYVFTRQGVVMLATILNTDIALEMTIRMINTCISTYHDNK